MNKIRPYGDHLNDGVVEVGFDLPSSRQAAAFELARKMGLQSLQLIHAQPLTGEHTHFVLQGVCTETIDLSALRDESDPQHMTQAEIEALAECFGRPLVIVGATTGTDTHSVGLDAILNQKGWDGSPGLESYKCFEVHNLGSQVPNEALVAYAENVHADAILVSATVTQQQLHVSNLQQLGSLARDKCSALIAGGPYITDEAAKDYGFDHGFGKNTLPNHVGTAIIRAMLERRVDLVHAAARAA